MGLGPSHQYREGFYRRNSARVWRTIRPVKSIRAGENLSLLINGLAVTVLVKAQGCDEPSWVPTQKIENLRVGSNAAAGAD